MPSQPTYRFGCSHAASIHIFFTKDKRPDDTLQIKPLPRSLGFTAKFTQNSNATQVEHQLTNTELVPYLERVFTSMMFDVQIYDYVQIDCPGYSSVVLNTKNVLSYLPILHSQIDSLQNSWPLESIGKRPSTSEPSTEGKLDSCMCVASDKAPVNYLITSSGGERHVETIPVSTSDTTTRRVTRSSTRAAGR